MNFILVGGDSVIRNRERAGGIDGISQGQEAVPLVARPSANNGRDRGCAPPSLKGAGGIFQCYTYRRGGNRRIWDLDRMGKGVADLENQCAVGYRIVCL